MHTALMLEQMVETAERAGYTVRLEWLGGAGGGACEFAGRKWIFVDLALSVAEQLEQVATALQDDPIAWKHDAVAPVRQYLAHRRAA